MRADQLLSLQLRRQPLARERAKRETMEHLAFHGTTLQQLALLDPQPLQTRHQQRLDCRRYLDVAALPCERGDLLQKERIALAGRNHLRPGPTVQPVAELVEQSLGLRDA